MAPSLPQPRVTLSSCALWINPLNPPDLVLTWMLRQDRQSGTITREQEEEGGRRSRGTALHRKGKGEGGGVKGRPLEQVGHSNHRYRGPFSRQSVKRDREGDREGGRTADIWKGGTGGFPLAFILLPLRSLSLTPCFSSSKQLERKRGYWQSKPGAAEKQHGSLVEW